MKLSLISSYIAFNVLLRFDPLNAQTSYLPAEDEEHEATWLAWPNDMGWDPDHVFRYEPIWLQVTEALAPSERVNILVWDAYQEAQVAGKLQGRNVDMNQITFYRWPTSDVWIRDYGPLFTFDNSTNQQIVTNWGFNGWGGKAPAAEYQMDDVVPIRVGSVEQQTVVPIPEVVLEGGAIEVDGRGTLMAKRSCVVHDSRNPGISEADIEAYLSYHLDVYNFIWLDGVYGQDITDDHIDGTARFALGNTIVTHKRDDFPAGQEGEYDILVNAVDAEGFPYEIVELPLSQKVVTDGNRGLYINYYVANNVVIVPAYNDPNDAVAAQIIGDLYPTRSVVSIDMTELYMDGGVVHCVTMQQPK